MIAEPLVPRHDFKIAFLNTILGEFGSQPLRVLDLGCGTAKDWPSILRAHPSVTWTGVEPDTRSRETARKLLDGFPATVIAGWGEGVNLEGGFDLTLSLSVLEHVKYLESFLRASVAATRSGGVIVHRYDLGHALYPASLYERALVTVSRRVPWLVPASRFTTHLEPAKVVSALVACGVSDVRVTHGQMYSLKQAMNYVSRIDGGEDLAGRLIALDAEVATTLEPILAEAQIAHLFPSVVVRGIKR
jgi:SAM-dependent methyltransferase